MFLQGIDFWTFHSELPQLIYEVAHRDGTICRTAPPHTHTYSATGVLAKVLREANGHLPTKNPAVAGFSMPRSNVGQIASGTRSSQCARTRSAEAARVLQQGSGTPCLGNKSHGGVRGPVGLGQSGARGACRRRKCGRSTIVSRIGDRGAHVGLGLGETRAVR